MIKYQRNNIIFRIASADAIGKFKQTQAHSFVQLARKELAFYESAKEVVLLEYDRFSQWIFRVEKICLTCGEGYISEPIRQSIIASFNEELRIVESVMETHTEVFSKDVFDFTKLVHTYSAKMVCGRLEKAAEQSADLAYPDMVDHVSTYLQHLLICLHEFNNNIIKKSQQPFVCIADFCLHQNTQQEQCEPALKRAKFFMEHGIENGFVLKNYSEMDAFRDFYSYLADFGIKILPEDTTATP